MKKQINIPNLIDLNSESKLDEIGFIEYDEFGENESPFTQYSKKIDEELCNELKISILEAKFIRYGWYGYSDQLPWKYNHTTEFNPNQISVIVPQTNSMFRVRGENRKIVLTHAPTYEGKKPFYFAVCTSKRELDNIRILDFVPGKMFYGLEKAITNEGFYHLPKLKDKGNYGIISIDKTDLIIPGNSNNYF